MKKNTVLGILAILFWSTNVAFSRRLAEQLGLLTSGTIMFLAGGVISLLYTLYQERSINFLKHSSKKYLLGCGILFILNTISLEVAVGLSVNRTQTIIVALINYLWPVFSLWFSLFILKKKAKKYLALGIFLAFGGMWLASTNGEILNSGDILQPHTLLVYALAMLAAVTWGLYSNLSRKWAGDQDSGAVSVFMLGSGLILGILRIFIPENSVFLPSTFFELAYMIIFPTILAYVFWDAAMRKGAMITVVTLSYFIPLLSTIISSIKLGVQLRFEIWVAAIMVIIGAYVCKIAIVEHE